MEEALKESEERYRMAIEHSSDAVIIFNKDRRIFFNKKYVEMLGYSSPEEVAGLPPFLSFIPMIGKRLSREPA
jgi:PAS domain S-box-containing protein